MVYFGQNRRFDHRNSWQDNYFLKSLRRVLHEIALFLTNRLVEILHLRTLFMTCKNLPSQK